MNEPLISVVMPTYNRRDYVKQAIDSVLCQTYQNFQLIVVDDGSTDGTRGVIEDISDPRVEYYPLDKNRQVCVARNYGLKKMKGEYVACLDSDDLFLPDKLEKQMAFLQAHPEYKICFSNISLIDEEGNHLCDQTYTELFTVKNQSQEEWLEEFFFRGNCLAHDTVLMHKEVMASIGEYDVSLIQLLDFDLWVKAAKRYPFYVLDEPLTKIRKFSDPVNNLSGYSADTQIRTGNEYSFLFEHYFDDMDDDLFLRVFRKYFRNPQAKSKLQLKCEQAFLFEKRGYPDIMLEKLIPLLNDEEAALILENEYDFTPKSFYEMNAIIAYSYPKIQQLLCEKDDASERLKVELIEKNEQLVEQKASCDALESKANSLELQLEQVLRSTSWKITKPVRWVFDKSRRNN